MISALDCLRIEIDTNWLRDRRGRLERERVPDPHPGSAPYFVWAASEEGTTVEVGAVVPDEVAAELQAAHRQEAPVDDLRRPPPGEAVYRSLVEQGVGPVAVVRVPCFVVDRPLTHPLSRTWSQRARVVLSSDADAAVLVGSAPPGHIDERRGPWAGVAMGERLISACSSARCSPHGVEAGTWTDPDHRGQGLAASATAAWTSLLLDGPRLLFYCTDDWNTSSQGVAARLALRPTGWMWRLDPPSEPPPR